MLGAILGIAILVLALLAFVFFTLNDLLVDRLWFESQGQLPVWDLQHVRPHPALDPGEHRGVRAADRSVWIAVARADDPAPRVTRVRPNLRGTNGPRGLRAARRGSGAGRGAADPGRRRRTRSRHGSWALVLTGVALLLALVIGLATSAEWQTLLLCQSQAATDCRAGIAAAAGPGAAIAGRVPSSTRSSVGRSTFYLFDLPFYRFAAEFLGSILDSLIVLTGIAYLVLARRSMSRPNGRLLGVAPGHPGRHCGSPSVPSASSWTSSAWRSSSVPTRIRRA